MSPSMSPLQTPSWLSRLTQRLPRFSAQFLTLDARSLGLGRVYLGLVLLADLLSRARDLTNWYTNEGLLPNHTLLWRPPSDHQLSFFFTASTWGEAAVLMALTGIVYVLFTVGYKTRVFHALAFIMAISLHGRHLLMEDGAEVTLKLLLFWTLFLPMGARFSIDALMTSLKARKEVHSLQLAERGLFETAPTRAVSIAVLALILQVMAVYGFNVVHKTGKTWEEGTVLHYVLHQDRIVTTLGLWLRPYVTLGISKFGTYSALVMEAAIVLFLVIPFKWQLWRRAAVITGISLHAGFAAFLNLGSFPWGMMAYFVMLIPPNAWDQFARWLGPSDKRKRLVYFDSTCGICFFTVRILARMDRLNRLDFRANDDPERPAVLTDELVQKTIVIFTPDTKRMWVKSAGFAQIFAALPFGLPLSLFMRIPGMSFVADFVYNRVAFNRTKISVALGFAACGLPQKSPPTLTPPAPTGLAATLAPIWPHMREVTAFVFLLAAAQQVFQDNRAVPKFLKAIPQPQIAKDVLGYLRMRQGWSMFAPRRLRGTKP